MTRCSADRRELSAGARYYVDKTEVRLATVCLRVILATARKHTNEEASHA